MVNPTFVCSVKTVINIKHFLILTVYFGQLLLALFQNIAKLRPGGRLNKVKTTIIKNKTQSLRQL